MTIHPKPERTLPQDFFVATFAAEHIPATHSMQAAFLALAPVATVESGLRQLMLAGYSQFVS